MSSGIYTINVSGEVFHFTKDQLQSEPGNYFASYFFGGSQGATNSTRELQLEKEPMLFRHIQTHLRGYKIFPIPAGLMPSYMDEMTALQNLQSDADFFGLRRLKGLVGAEIQKLSLNPPTAPKRPVTTLGNTDVRYRLWTHTFIEQPVNRNGHRTQVSNGAYGGTRTWTDMSKEGLELFRAKCGDPSFSCLDCLKVTPGWNFVMAASILPKVTVGPACGIPVHYVVESQ